MNPLSPEIAAAAAASGAIVGFLLAAFGGGGSVLATPLLLYVVGVKDAHLAIGTSSAAVAANAAVSLVGHWRGGRVKWPCASVFAAAGLAGAVAGSALAKSIDGKSLLLAFAFAMAAIAASMLRQPKSTGDAGVTLTPAIAARVAPLGLGAGLASGFFGIGGGFLIVPGLMAATGMPLSFASASSLVAVTLFGVSTAASYAVSGWVDWSLAALMIAGGAAGGGAGLVVARKLASRALIARRLFAGLVFAVAIYVAWRATTG
jgi:hypothetical protein